MKAADARERDQVDHIAKATSQLKLEHETETSQLQSYVDRLTAMAGHPSVIVIIIMVAGWWMIANSVARFFSIQPLDPPPFLWLQGAITTASLCIAALILTTQRRESRLASHHVQLILEIAIRAEQKSAKAIELLEESRRDNPMLENRIDVEANAMSAPTDHSYILSAIKSGHL